MFSSSWLSSLSLSLYPRPTCALARPLRLRHILLINHQGEKKVI